MLYILSQFTGQKHVFTAKIVNSCLRLSSSAVTLDEQGRSTYKQTNRLGQIFYCIKTEGAVCFLCFRNVEADVALRSTAAVFTYCRSRGLFAGISLEGSYLIERKETNRKCVQKNQNTCYFFLHPCGNFIESSGNEFLCVSGLQVLLQRHPCIGHFERRCGASE